MKRLAFIITFAVVAAVAFLVYMSVRPLADLAADETEWRAAADKLRAPSVIAAVGETQQGEKPVPDASDGVPIPVTDETFEAQVLNSLLPVVVFFWAEWAGPAKHIAPIVADLARNLSDKIIVAKLNIDMSPMTTQKYGVRGIPTLILFKNGEVAATKVGGLSKNQLYAWVEKNLGDGVDRP